MFLDDEHKQRINSKRQPRDKLFGGRKECCISFFLSLSFRKSFVCRVELPQPTSALFLYPSHPPSSPHPVSPHPLSICKAKFILRSLQTPDNGEVSCQSCCRLAAWSPVSWAPGLSSDLQNEAHWLIWAVYPSQQAAINLNCVPGFLTRLAPRGIVRDAESGTEVLARGVCVCRSFISDNLL